MRPKHQHISSRRSMKKVWDDPRSASGLVSLQWQLPRGICEKREHKGLEAKAQGMRGFLSSPQGVKLSLKPWEAFE